jgi:hypothetical protein
MISNTCYCGQGLASGMHNRSVGSVGLIFGLQLGLLQVQDDNLWLRSMGAGKRYGLAADSSPERRRGRTVLGVAGYGPSLPIQRKGGSCLWPLTRPRQPTLAAQNQPPITANCQGWLAKRIPFTWLKALKLLTKRPCQGCQPFLTQVARMAIFAGTVGGAHRERVLLSLSFYY